ncbi:hypothetical protein [Halorussus lipolyticus]|uniref:hypothetical protein n=1 Tax=Halorussus lipolyticus TaxID=3034024 RepID=UPI0023E81ACC|nr:hypothetical protein [Halorussus sp. DT80]
MKVWKRDGDPALAPESARRPATQTLLAGEESPRGRPARRHPGAVGHEAEARREGPTPVGRPACKQTYSVNSARVASRPSILR